MPTPGPTARGLVAPTAALSRPASLLLGSPRAESIPKPGAGALDQDNPGKEGAQPLVRESPRVCAQARVQSEFPGATLGLLLWTPTKGHSDEL